MQDLGANVAGHHILLFFAKILQKWIQDFARIFTIQIVPFSENRNYEIPTVQRKVL
jgi:hypothetical protein